MNLLEFLFNLSLVIIAFFLCMVDCRSIRLIHVTAPNDANDLPSLCLPNGIPSCNLRSAFSLCTSNTSFYGGCKIVLPYNVELQMLSVNRSKGLFFDLINELPFSISILGNGSTVTCVDRPCDINFLTISAPIQLNISDLSLIGFGTSGSTTFKGGSLSLTNLSYSNLNRVLFKSNQAGIGGGLFIQSCNNIIIDSCEFINNTASTSGGGIVITDSSYITISSTNISNNNAVAVGGGVYFIEKNSHILIINTNISHNSATMGGGIHFKEINSNNIINSTYITYNHAINYGGGICIDDNNDQITLSHSMIHYNKAPLGAGIYIIQENDNFLLSSSSISHNNALDGSGGGLYLSDTNSYVIIQNSIFDSNSATSNGGGIFINNNNLYLSIIECDIISNTAEQSGGGLYSESTNNYLKIIFNTKFITNSAGYNGGGFLINIDHSNMLINDTHILNNFASKNGGGFAFSDYNYEIVLSYLDIIGNFANSFGGGGSIGKYNSDISLNSMKFESNGALLYGGGVQISSYNEYIELNSVVLQYNQAFGAGGIFVYYRNLYTKINNCFIDGNYGEVDAGGIYLYQENENSEISSCIITNNLCTWGGGMEFDTYNLYTTIESSYIAYNTAIAGGGSYVYFSNKHVLFIDCIFVGNYAEGDGGGMIIHQYITNITIINSTFSYNNAGYGGGVFISGSNVIVNLMDSTFTDNTAIYGAGVILYQTNDNVLFSHCIFLYNIASGPGGGVLLFSQNSNIILKFCTFIGNSAVEAGGGLSLHNYNFGVIVSYCTFLYNHAYDGGAISLDSHSDSFMLSQSILINNTCIFNGGGMKARSSFDIYLTSSIMSGNIALHGSGGAIYLLEIDTFSLNDVITNGNSALKGDGGGLLLVSCLSSSVANVHFKNNIAKSGGGFNAVASNYILNILYCIFESNTGSAGGGGLVIGSGNSVVSIFNSKFTSNIALDGFGGGILAGDSNEDLIFTNSTFCTNIASKGNGGALSVTSNTIGFYIAYSEFSNNKAYQGGAIAMALFSKSFTLNTVQFINNSAMTNGGAIWLFSDSKDIIFRNIIFRGNSAHTDGGSVYIGDHNLRVSFENCHFYDSKTGLNGGAIYFSRFNMLITIQVTIDNCIGSGGGGAIYLDYENKNVTIYQSRLINNVGGALLIFSKNSILIRNTTIQRNSMTGSGGGGLLSFEGNFINIWDCDFLHNTADTDGGGAIYLVTAHSFCSIQRSHFINNSITSSSLSSSSLLSSTVYPGGAIYVGGTGNTHIVFRDCIISHSATAGSGGGIAISNVDKLTLTGLIMSSNTAVGTGGAMSITGVNNDVNIDNCIFQTNTALNDGGALYLSSITAVTIARSSFVSNEVSTNASGSAIFIESSTATISGNSFINNTAGIAGTVYWNSQYMVEPVGLSSSTSTSRNKWSGNIATYGSNYATDLYSISTPASVSTVRYTSKDELPQVIVKAYDYYHQKIITENKNYVDVQLDDVIHCHPNLGSLVGVTSEAFSNGEATFKTLFGLCTPGGHFHLSFTVPYLKSSKHLQNNTFTEVKFPLCLKGDPTTSPKCTCPAAATECIGNNVIIESKYWRVNNNAYTGQICPNTLACEGGSESGDISCGEGYLGPLCKACTVGYFLTKGECKACNGNSATIASLAVCISFIIFVACAIALYHYVKFKIETKENLSSPNNSTISNNYGMSAKLMKFAQKAFPISDKAGLFTTRMKHARNNLKVIISALQIVAALKNSVDFRLPAFFTTFIGGMGWADVGAAFQYFPMNCVSYFSTSDYITMMLLTTTAPFAIALLWYILYQFARIWTGRKRRLLREKIRMHFLYYFLLFRYLILPGVSVVIVNTFPCMNVDPDGASDPGSPSTFLRVDPRIACSSARYQEGVLWGVLMIIAYPIGFPLSYYALLYINREKISSPDRQEEADDTELESHMHWYNDLGAIAFLYEDFKPKFWYWEVIETIRRIILTAAVSVVSTESVIQLSFGIVISIIFVKVYGFVRPYETDETDDVQELAQYQVLLTFFGGLLLKFSLIADSPTAVLCLSILLVAINMMPSAFVLYNIIWSHVKYDKNERDLLLMQQHSRKASFIPSLAVTPVRSQIYAVNTTNTNNGMESGDAMPPTQQQSLHTYTNNIINTNNNNNSYNNNGNNDSNNNTSCNNNGNNKSTASRVSEEKSQNDGPVVLMGMDMNVVADDNGNNNNHSISYSNKSNKNNGKSDGNGNGNDELSSNGNVTQSTNEYKYTKKPTISPSSSSQNSHNNNNINRVIPFDL